MPKKYAPIKTTKASDLIVEEIWSAILNGELAPGERLPPERDLVEQFCVSKVTVREALQTLVANGYIDRKRGATGGSIVRELTPTKGIDLICEYLAIQRMQIDELIDARLLIEPLICKHVANCISSEQAHQLELLLEKHQKEYETTGKSKFGWFFEQYLARLTNNRILSVIEDLLVNIVKRNEEEILASSTIDEAFRSSMFKQYYSGTFTEHRAIADAILGHDPEKAKQAMITHRQNWATLFRKLYEASVPDRGHSS
jgi:GntR family transcriptional repressor for pyruvate dehydrogenase complex